MHNVAVLNVNTIKKWIQIEQTGSDDFVDLLIKIYNIDLCIHDKLHSNDNNGRPTHYHNMTALPRASATID